jgi:hypothetical protein
MRARSAAVSAFLLLCAGPGAQPQDVAQTQDETPVFGTTVVLPSGLRGEVYNLKPNTSRLPNFKRLKPVGVIYTNSLNIAPREFTSGFPGVTDRFEWFAIDYTGRFWIEKPGNYSFRLLSDDGAILYVDDHQVIDNDGAHVPVWRQGDLALPGGIHSVRVSYFQGRRFRLALVLQVKGPGDADYRVFSTEEFKPPPHPEDWKFGAQVK